MQNEKCAATGVPDAKLESFATGRLESLPYRFGLRGECRKRRFLAKKAWFLEKGLKLKCSAFAAFCRLFSRYKTLAGGGSFWRHQKQVLSRLVPVCPRRKWLMSRGGVFLSHVASGWCPALSQRKWLISSESEFFQHFFMGGRGRVGRMKRPRRPALARCLGSSGASPSHLGKPEFCLKAAAGCGRLVGPGPMECGLTNPARAGMQQRQFAPHPPWSPWHLNFECGARSAE
jgi:hypothetical protein